PLYKRVVTETLEWVKRELTGPDGRFYCALDADSEGVEGKFYTFHRSEIEQVLGADAELFCAYFGVTETGNWEEEEINVLKADMDADRFAQEAGFTADEWETYLREAKRRLLEYRSQRVRPGLDDKLLASWNGLMLKAFLDAYRVFDSAEYLDAAKANASFIRRFLYADDGSLLHQPAANGKVLPAFLDDYAFCIDAFATLYEATFEEEWIYEAKRLLDMALERFYEEDQKVFYYTADTAEQLIARKQEIMDNVIPSSTSAIARQLNRLGLFFDHPPYRAVAAQLLANVAPQLPKYGSAYSNWAILLLEEVVPCSEIVLTGPGWLGMRRVVDIRYIPNKIILGGTKGTLPLLTNRIANDKTQAYVCRNKTCSLPVYSEQELVELLIT